MSQFFKIFTLYLSVIFSSAWGSWAFASQTTILVMGDSLSAGYGMSLDKAWPSLLQTKLQQSSPQTQWKIINASVSGETTQGGVRRLPSLLAEFEPDWVLLELGANDGLRGYPIANISANLAAMITQIQTSGAKTAVLGIQLPPNYGARYTGPFFKQYATLAKKFDTALVPFLLDEVAVYSELMQPDGLHPTISAQPIIVDNVWRHLSKFWID
jgi:acyl-CoA thioesterase-1